MEKTYWEIRASEEGYTSLSKWITDTLNKEIGLVLDEPKTNNT